MLFRKIDSAACVAEIARTGVVSIPCFINATSCRALLADIQKYQFVEEPKEKGDYGVQQEFSAVTEFASDGLVWSTAKDLEKYLGASFEESLSSALSFTHLVAQHYEPGPVGISAHRDGKSFINLIAVLVLQGHARFCVCEDRNGSGAREVENSPGTLLLMRGPGFLGQDVQPFHFVDRVTTQRTTLSFRQRQS